MPKFEIPGLDQFEKLVLRSAELQTSLDEDICKKCKEHMLDCECEETTDD